MPSVVLVFVRDATRTQVGRSIRPAAGPRNGYRRKFARVQRHALRSERRRQRTRDARSSLRINVFIVRSYVSRARAPPPRLVNSERALTIRFLCARQAYARTHSNVFIATPRLLLTQYRVHHIYICALAEGHVFVFECSRVGHVHAHNTFKLYGHYTRGTPFDE